jgi:hypothetical protein
MRRRARAYIAQEAFRRYGPIEPTLAVKLQRNIRRNLGVTVPRDEIQRLADRYKAMYEYGARRLGKYLRPASGYYAHSSDVKLPEFRADLAARYPSETRRTIEMLLWYVVFYEHLK